nr:NADH-quinone oxidoreductase subunit M [Solirubrobacteraceae bacterium]
FFLYTMAGSVPFLAAVILLGAESHAQTGRWSFDLDVLEQLRLAPGRETFVFAAIALACAVKSPLVPFHSWLPLAYREAPASATALMAGVMSKMGAYGFLRLALPLCPDAAGRAAPLLVGLAVLTLLYGALLALVERDYKRLAAWASLSHTGYIVLGLFAFAATSIHGAMVQILSHGLVAGGLFLVLGLLEQRRGAAYAQLDALAARAPRLAVLTMLFVLASLALPLTSSFTAELLVLLGAFGQGLGAWQAGAGAGLLVAALLAALGVVLGASYMLRFARRLVFAETPARLAGDPLADLRARELLALAPLVLLVLALGIRPGPFMAKTEPTVSALARPPAVLEADGTASSRAAGRVAAHARGAHGAR